MLQVTGTAVLLRKECPVEWLQFGSASRTCCTRMKKEIICGYVSFIAVTCCLLHIGLLAFIQPGKKHKFS